MFAAVGGLALDRAALEASPLDSSAIRVHSKGRQGNRKNYNNNNNAQQKAQHAAQQKAQRAAATARLERARQLLAATANHAGVAHLQLQNAAGKVATAKNTLDTSKDAGESASDELHQIETEIEESQAADSPYAKGVDNAVEASEAFKKLRDKIEASPDYRAAKSAALSGDNKPDKLAHMEQKFFTSNPDYIQARSGAELMVARLREIRSALFAADSRWLATAQRSKDARSQASEANKQLQGSLLHKADAAESAREAAAAANAAQALVKLREAQAKAAGAKDQGSKNKKPSSSSKK